jgi:hypothetical protein
MPWTSAQRSPKTAWQHAPVLVRYWLIGATQRGTGDRAEAGWEGGAHRIAFSVDDIGQAHELAARHGCPRFAVWGLTRTSTSSSMSGRSPGQK